MVLIREALTHESDIHQKNTESDIDQRGIETRRAMSLLHKLHDAVRQALIVMTYFDTFIIHVIHALHAIHAIHAIHASFVYDVTDTDCWAQNGSSHGRVIATFERRVCKQDQKLSEKHLRVFCRCLFVWFVVVFVVVVLRD